MKKCALRILLVIVLALGTAAGAWAGTIYVKANATGANTGRSWANAYKDLQTALAHTQSGDEVWVASSTYKPTAGTNPTISFVMTAGVGIYGGFSGTETARAQRDWAAHKTTLSGDIGTLGTDFGNSYHEVVGANSAVLDGFTITCAYDGGYGDACGMINDSVSPAIVNCTFSDNNLAGIRNCNRGSPTVTNCMFGGNDGNGMYNDGNLNFSPTVTDCTFSGNGGAGIGNGGGSPTVTNCTFSDNNGGGMCNSGSSPTVTNCTFSGNTASNGGGMYNYDGAPKVTNCTFSGNMASNGGGMYNSAASPTVTNCILYGDNETHGPEVYMSGGNPTFRHCDIQGSGGSGTHWNPSQGTDGGGNIMIPPRFVDAVNPAGPDGIWRTADDGLAQTSDSPCIDAGLAAGAPATDVLGNPRVGAPDIGAYEFLPETISKPGKPTGEPTSQVEQSYTYSTSGAVSSLGHPVEYSFDWGDGNSSAWSSSTSASHTWANMVPYQVSVTARCQLHPTVTNISDPLSVNVVPVELSFFDIQ